MPSRLTHGHTAKNVGRTTPEYRSWRAMKNRCLRPDPEHMSYYGLSIDPRWAESFEAFLSDMGPRPSLDHTLDRIDGTKGYSADNCRWATKQQQAHNRSTNVYQGTSVEAKAIEAGVAVHTVRSRLRRGYSPEEALTPKGQVIRCGHNGDCARGAKNIHAKLDDERVRQILSRSDERSTELARQFGVSKTTINLIRARKVWSHINV